MEHDPELARWLWPDEVVEARRCVLAATTVVPVGAWTAPRPTAGLSDHLGYLVLEGLLAHEESIGGCVATELLGPGDLIQPWNDRPDETLLARSVTWEALEQARLAVLGPAFVSAIKPFPRLGLALVDRAMNQSARLATHRALCQLSPIDTRLLFLFWHLAERWGHVAAGTVILPVRLSHEALGRLAAAKRSTVTLALHRLAESGAVRRRGDGAWVLSRDAGALAEVDALARDVALQRAVLLGNRGGRGATSRLAVHHKHA